MTINELIFFKALCENNSIRKTSQQLFITPQGLGKALDSLEKELGCQLLTRSPKGIEMTEGGQIVYEHSKTILTTLDNMKSELDVLLAREENIPLKVAAANGVIRALGVEQILEFRKHYPKIEVQVKTLSDYEVDNNVYQGEVDLGLTLGPVDEDKYEAELLRTHKLMLLVNRDNPLAKQNEVSYKELKDEKIILIEDVFKSHHKFLDNCQKAGFKPNIIVGINELEHGYKYVCQNLGIAYSVDFALNDIDTKLVKAIPLTDGNNDWSVYAITKKNSNIAKMIKIFKSFIH